MTREFASAVSNYCVCQVAAVSLIHMGFDVLGSAFQVAAAVYACIATRRARELR